MSIELTPESREEAITSLQQYAETMMDEPLGNIEAAGLLEFFLEEIGPSVYNKAVADVQERMQSRVAELDLDVNQEEFAYWRRRANKKR